MKTITQLFFILPLAFILLSTQAFAVCTIEKNPKDLTLDEVATYYECAKNELSQGYQQGSDITAKNYNSWKAAATGPAKPGLHGNRYLMTYVNDIGYDSYVAYATSNVNVPVGSIIAKESFTIKSAGKLKPGPLFIMEKVGKDKAPDAGGWLYSAVKASGKPMPVKQSFCHSCHQAYAAQDALGYPVPAVRLK